MKLELRELRIPLADFGLELDLEITKPRTALFGPSGAGKTSLLETIAGFRAVESGRICFGKTIFADAARGISMPVRERHVGYLPQDDSLFPHFSVRRNLRYGWRADAEGSRPAFNHVIDFLGIGGLLARDVGSLSRGEKQRVALGRALLAGPRLLLLDEPLTALDEKLKAQALPHLRALHDEFGVPMIYVTHDRAEALALCDEVLLLERGRITARGAPAELLTR